MMQSAQILPFPMAKLQSKRSPNRMRQLRLDRGMTQEQVALEAGCAISTINMMERGERTLSLEWMQRLAKVFGVAPSELLTVENNPNVLDDDERALIDALRAAPEANRAALLGAAEHLIGYKPEPVEPPLPRSRKSAA